MQHWIPNKFCLLCSGKGAPDTNFIKIFGHQSKSKQCSPQSSCVLKLDKLLLDVTQGSLDLWKVTDWSCRNFKLRRRSYLPGQRRHRREQPEKGKQFKTDRTKEDRYQILQLTYRVGWGTCLGVIPPYNQRWQRSWPSSCQSGLTQWSRCGMTMRRPCLICKIKQTYSFKN